MCSSWSALSDGILYAFLPETTFSDSGRKRWTIVHGFDQISFRIHNSSLKGDMDLLLTWAWGALSNGIVLFASVEVFRFWPTTMDYRPNFFPCSQLCTHIIFLYRFVNNCTTFKVTSSIKRASVRAAASPSKNTMVSLREQCLLLFSS